MNGCAPRYETARLLLRLASPDLAPAVADYYCRNRSFLAPFDPVREERFFTEERQRALLEEEANSSREDRSYRFYLSLKGEPARVVGLAGLNQLVRGAFQSCFLGYKLDAALCGQGYMTEAVQKLSEIAFKELGLHRIEANIMPRNAASLRVAEKAGFYREGLALKYLNINGVWEDHIHMVRRSDS